jgi:peptide/nickel transport system substrate-binding protein
VNSKKDLDGWAKEIPGLNVVQRQLWVTASLWVQTQSGPTTDVRVRQALMKAVNRQEIRDTVYFGSGWMSPEVLLPGRDYILPDAELSKLLGYDPQGAKQLLQAAGVSNWQPKLLVSNINPHPAVGELMQAQLKEVGISANIESIDVARFTEQVLAQGQFELCVSATSPGNSTNADLKSRWGTGGGRNAGRLSNPALDALIDKQSQTFDKGTRLPLLQDAQRMILTLASIVPGNGNFSWDIAQPFFRDWETTGADYYEYTNYQFPWLDQ